MHLSISSPTPGRPHTLGGDLTLTLVPTPGVVDIDVENFPIFVAVADTGMGSHSLLFEVAIAQYLAKMCCQIPLITRAWGHSGDLTAGLAPGVGHLTTKVVKSPGGGGVGHKIDKCIKGHFTDRSTSITWI